MNQLALNSQNNQQHPSSLSFQHTHTLNIQIFAFLAVGQIQSQINQHQLSLIQQNHLCEDQEQPTQPNENVMDNDEVPMTFDVLGQANQDFLSTLRQSIGVLSSKSKNQLSLKICRSQRPCVICQQQIKKRSKVYNLKCRHYFHSDCLKKWHEKHSTCPLCREQLR